MRINSGLTLVEVLVSAGIAILLVLSASMSIINSQFMASYARHKIQAMYAAQQLLEQKRQQTFSPANSVTVAPVILDTYNSNDPLKYFYGTSTITVLNLDANRNQVKVEINWNERVMGGVKVMKEFYTTNIANDPIPN